MERLEYSKLDHSVRGCLEVPEEDFDLSPVSVQHFMLKAALEKLERERQAASVERNISLAKQAAEQMRARGIPDRIGQRRPDPPRVFHPVRNTIDLSSEFPINEPEPTSLIGGRLTGFRKESIVGMIPRMQETMLWARQYESVQRGPLVYMLFHVWSGGTRRAGTELVHVGWSDESSLLSDINELYKKLKILLSDISKVDAGYEYVYEQEDNHIHFYFNVTAFPRPANIERWGECVEPLEERQYFDIFTASGEGDCVRQCAKRLDIMTSGKSITLDDILSQRKVCILNLRSGLNKIKGVMDYRDLVPSKDSPVKSFNVIDPECVYLLQHNGHVGLVENFKDQRRNRYHTTFRPLMRFPKCERVTACFDIECYFDPHANQTHIPYLACACISYDDVPGNVIEFTERDCVASMIDYFADIALELKIRSIELIAHNGGGYDFHYILSSMADPSIAAKAFLDETDRKTDFPHHEVLTEADLQKEMQEWLSVDTIVSANVEKERMYITADHVVQYRECSESKKLIEWARQYCRNDVIVLTKVWIAFKHTVQSVFKCGIVDDTHTLAGMSFRLLEAHLSSDVKLLHPTKADFMNMRAALVGGRCISLNDDVEPYEAWYTTVDIDLAIAEGHSVKYLPFDDHGDVGYSWKNKKHIFKDYITDVLYKLKQDYEDQGDTEKRHVIKIIMNSLWGKFAQKWMDTKYKILHEHDVVSNDLTQQQFKIWDTDHVLCKSTVNKTLSDKPVQNGVFVLRMLEIEHIFDEFITVGKKQYMGKYGSRYKYRFKGVPQAHIKPEMYSHLLDNPSNSAQIDFLKFKREWGSVKGYIE
ncbi:hypothetical protein H4R27_005626, partial [Coemansia aciculifera]